MYAERYVQFSVSVFFRKRFYVAYRLVHSLAVLSCWSLFCKYSVAMLPTSGSSAINKQKQFKKESQFV